MNALNTFERPDYHKYSQLREALAGARGLVPEQRSVDAPGADTGLRLDGFANLAVICTGITIVLVTAAVEGLYVVAPALG